MTRPVRFIALPSETARALRAGAPDANAMPAERAVSDGKLHLELENTHPNWTSAQQKGKGRPAKLVNLKSDLKETTDVSAGNPAVMQRMHELIAKAKAELGDDDQRGSGQRDAKTLDRSKPMLLVE